MPVKAESGITGRAIYMIGFLSGALILLILFMATPMGEGLIGKSLMGKGWRKMENSGKSPQSCSGAVQATTFFSTRFSRVGAYLEQILGKWFCRR